MHRQAIPLVQGVQRHAVGEFLVRAEVQHARIAIVAGRTAFGHVMIRVVCGHLLAPAAFALTILEGDDQRVAVTQRFQGGAVQ